MTAIGTSSTKFLIAFAAIWLAGVAPAAAMTALFAASGNGLALATGAVLVALLVGGPVAALQARARLFPSPRA